MNTNSERFKLGFLAGSGAGILATTIMLLLSFTIGGVSLPDVLGSALALTMPLPLFNYLHQLIGADAKHYLFYGALVGQCLVFGLCGAAWSLLLATRYARYLNFSRQTEANGIHWESGLFLAALLWLLSGLVFLPLIGGGVFGSALVIGTTNTMLSLAIVGIAFGLLFVFIHNWLILHDLQRVNRAQGKTDGPVTEAIEQRRSFLRGGLIALGIGTLGWVGIRFILNGGGGSSGSLTPASQTELLKSYQAKISPPPTPHYGNIQQVPQLSTEITPNNTFYTVSKNLASDPTVDGNSWHMTIDGEVKHAYKLNYAELTSLPLKQQYESLMCISNEVGGEYMSNARWEGIQLKDLLQRAGGVKAGATKVVLHAADGYSDSIHLTKALEPTTLVAIRMNGETLPQQHGYPARLLVPGIYGMKHVKWITRIEVVNTDYQGYWQQSGWSDPAPVRMTSRIDAPTANAVLSAEKPTFIAGVAFSGNKGISQVDVSLDGGKNWQIATLKRPLSDLTWVLWEIPWRPTKGTYTIVVRAIDLQGNVQNPNQAPPLPDGSSGYHSITVRAS